MLFIFFLLLTSLFLLQLVCFSFSLSFFLSLYVVVYSTSLFPFQVLSLPVKHNFLFYFIFLLLLKFFTLSLSFYLGVFYPLSLSHTHTLAQIISLYITQSFINLFYLFFVYLCFLIKPTRRFTLSLFNASVFLSLSYFIFRFSYCFCFYLSHSYNQLVHKDCLNSHQLYFNCFIYSFTFVFVCSLSFLVDVNSQGFKFSFLDPFC